MNKSSTHAANDFQLLQTAICASFSTHSHVHPRLYQNGTPLLISQQIIRSFNTCLSVTRAMLVPKFARSQMAQQTAASADMFNKYQSKSIPIHINCIDRIIVPLFSRKNTKKTITHVRVKSLRLNQTKKKHQIWRNTEKIKLLWHSVLISGEFLPHFRSNIDSLENFQQHAAAAATQLKLFYIKTINSTSATLIVVIYRSTKLVGRQFLIILDGNWLEILLFWHQV